MLNNEDINTCGIERVITIKINSKVMIRRNIDVSIGLVNGTIGTVTSIRKDKDEITNLLIKLRTGEEHLISRLEYKFIIMDKICIVREQFPICNSYGITIHKSQGLSLQNAVVEAGNCIFSCGQTYVALSRVTKLEGLNLINFDPSRIMAEESAILEYNRLRKKYCPYIQPFDISNKQISKRKIQDTIWTISKNILQIQNDFDYISEDKCWNIFAIPNKDGFSSYVNVCIHSLFHSVTIRRVLIQCKGSDILKDIFNQYISKINIDVDALKQNVSVQYMLPRQQDAATFFKDSCNTSKFLQNVIQHELNVVVRCPGCDTRNQSSIPNYILMLDVPESSKAHLLQELIDYNIGNWREIDETCYNNCKSKKIRNIDIQITNTILIVQLMLFEIKDPKKKNK